jgi:hypothetical protein
MAEKKMTIYELGKEYQSWEALVRETMTDENGDAKELSNEDKEYLTECFLQIGGDIKQKLINMYYIYRNMEAESNIADAERGVFKAEFDRLGRIAKAKENKAKGIKGLIVFIMDIMKMKEIVTPVFTAKFQSTQKSVKTVDGFFNPDLIPIEFLDREISSSKVKKAVEEGRLYEKYKKYKNQDGKEVEENVMDRGKLFYKDLDGIEQELKYVNYLGGETLFIR